MTSRVKGLTPESFETLRREIGALKRQLANQERRLATVSTRRHEAVWVPQGRHVEWSSSNTYNTSVTNVINNSEIGHVYFSLRRGPQDIGITHDPAESAPQTNGNFTCTKRGMYRCDMGWVINRSGSWSQNMRCYRFGIWRYRDSAWTQYPQTIQTIVPGTASWFSGSWYATGAASFLIDLAVDEKLYFQVAGLTGTTDSALCGCTVGFQKVGEFADPVAVP